MSMIQQIESWASDAQRMSGVRPIQIDMTRAYFDKLKAEIAESVPMVKVHGLSRNEICGMKIIIHD